MSSNIYDKEQKKLIPFAGNSEATAGSLDGLSDVNISSPTDGQVLTYDAANEVWINGEGATVIESLGDIADVDLTNLQDGQSIIWDSTYQKWINYTPTTYTAGHGISIDNGVISDKTFVGTTAQWEALTPAQQALYEERVLTDDEPDVQQKTNGHIIKDEDGVSKTQRSNLQFEGLDVTDDDVNDKTIVAPTTLKNEVYGVMGQMGAKNLLPRALTNIITHNTSGSWNGNNYTINGVTFTVNSDGGITANGTATASNTSLFIYGGVYGALQENFLVKDVPYKLSSGIVNNVKAYIKWQSFLDNSGTLVEQGDSRNENLAITEDAPYIRFMCHVENGTTVTNLTFYPMIRLASDTDDTYQPYAMTNKELTNALADKAEQSEVDDIADTLAKNVYSTLVRFEELTPGLIYTVPEEGYLNVVSNDGTGYVIVQDANGNQLGNVGYCFSTTILLKKGMKVVLPSSVNYVPNDVRFRY